jgi:hypothetical protein
MIKNGLFIVFLLIPIFIYAQTEPKEWKKKKIFPLFNLSHSKVSKNERKKPFQDPKRETVFMYPEWSFDGGLGISNSFTDIGGKKWEGKDLFMDVQLRTTKLAHSFYIGYRYKTKMGYGFSFNYGKFSGSDAFGPKTSRTARNNSFTNRIYEFGFNHKFYLLTNIIKNGWTYQEPTQYYVYYGIYTFINNPVLADPTGKYEPQKKISKFQISIPIGFGIHHTFENHLRVGVDFAWRKTFTDYLDGFTTKFSKRKDSYTFTSIFVGYALSKNNYKKRTNENKKQLKIKEF